MFDVKVSDEQITYAEFLITHYNFGQRGYGDGSPKEQRTGMIGQVVLADLLGLPRPTGEEGFDGGYDFVINGKKVDLKTMSRTGPMKSFYVHNFIGYQIKYDTQIFIVASLNTTNNILTICGTVTKERILEKAVFTPQGGYRMRSDGTRFKVKAPLYEIEQQYICNADSLQDIIKNI